jgi:predicted DsbA family dithiol-disulfide isomerase
VPSPVEATVNVEIFADVVCPWCYLGQARFPHALAGFDGDVQVTHRWGALLWPPEVR